MTPQRRNSTHHRDHQRSLMPMARDVPGGFPSFRRVMAGGGGLLLLTMAVLLMIAKGWHL